MRISAIAVVGTLLMAALGWGQAFAPEASYTPKPDLKDIRIDQKLGASVPLTAKFKDETGRPVQLGEFLGARPVLVLPIFYRCQGVCALELQSLLDNLQKAKRTVGKDYDVVAISIDPQEGPDIAKRKKARSLDPIPAFAKHKAGWHFLTGSLDQIRSVTDALGFYYRYDAATDAINHPSGIMFLTPAGVISSYYLGANYAPGQLTADIDRASRKKVGEKVPDVFFGCIHIDPLTGQRSLVIEGVLRLAGIATIIAIAGALTFMSIGRSRKRKSAI